MFQMIAPFIVTAFAGFLAIATAEVPDDYFFLDMSEKLECDVAFGRSTSKLIIGDFDTFNTRQLLMVDNQDQIVQIHNAQCGFEDNLYICRWKKGRHITIDVSNASVSEVTAKPKRFVHGKAKLDVFRPQASVTCPLENSLN